ncbi:hypothetical protein [Buchnera aphidicola]
MFKKKVIKKIEKIIRIFFLCLRIKFILSIILDFMRNPKNKIL